jgi:hypothetical protein
MENRERAIYFLLICFPFALFAIAIFSKQFFGGSILGRNAARVSVAKAWPW